MKRPALIGFLAAAVMLCLGSLPAQDAPTYQTGYNAIMKLGSDLYRSLKTAYRNEINVRPVSLETDVMPFIKPVEYPDESKPMRMVFISVGFVDLMNNVAHAKAIDKVKKGYFEKYVLSLAEESGASSLKELPGLSDKSYWSDDMMNEQLSNFNQMVGMVVAIELSHHYLGHFKKYADKLSDEKDKTVAINNLLTPQEWDESVKAGAQNALDSGLGMDGIKALYDCIDKMPQRPAWAAYFLPNSVKVSKLKKDLEKIEKKFFQ